MQTVTFYALNTDGTYRAPLPDVRTFDLSPQRNSPGTIRLTYPEAGKNFAVLHEIVEGGKDLEVAVWVDGTERPQLRALLQEASGDDVDEAAVWSFTGRFLGARMQEAVVEPRTTVADPPSGPAPTTDLAAARFYSDTAGTIMDTLLTEAQARGALSDITYDFTGAVDSDGTAWSSTITLKIAPGSTYLKVLDGLVEAQLCEWVMHGRELRLYEPERGSDLTLSDPPIVLRAGRDLVDAPRKHTVRDAGTTLLVAGSDGLYVEQTDATAQARRGRRIEVYDSQGSLSDNGSLTAYAQARLPLVTSAKLEVSHGLAFTGDGPLPLDDFDVDDWLWSDTGSGLERRRVAQWTVSGDEHGQLSGNAVLNDLIAAREAALAARIDGIAGGTTVTGTSAAQPADGIGSDTLAPAAPQGLAATSLPYQDSEGVTRASVTATWGEVITNSDGTAINDLDGYRVRYRYTSSSLPNGNVIAGESTTESLTWSGLLAGEGIEVEVAAFDRSGNLSAWSTPPYVLVTQTDTTPPPVPSAPVVSQRLGTVEIEWDGLGSAGEVMPPDLLHVEVHVSTTSSFTPGAGTLFDRLATAGTAVYTGGTYGVTLYARLIAVDRTGNKSDPSAQGSAAPRPVGLQDITFKDRGNLVEDGSFEDVSMRAERTSGPWSFTESDARHGGWALSVDATNGAGTQRALQLTPLIPLNDDEEFWLRGSAKPGASVDGTLQINAVIYDDTDTAVLVWSLDFTSADGTDWADKGRSFTASFDFGGETGVVSGSKIGFEVKLLDTATTGTWLVDRIEVRPRVGTLLVQDLAVTNAKIADLDVGKLTAGIMTAEVTVSGRFRTSESGERVEFDDTGIRRYDTDGTTVLVEISEADVNIQGRLVAGDPAASRIEIGGNDTRDSIFVHNVLGELVVVVGQVYSTDTGDPQSNGILVDHGPTGIDLFEMYGSGDGIGLFLQKTDEQVRLRFREGESDVVRVIGTDGAARVFLGELGGGEIGVAVEDTSDGLVCSVRPSEFFYKATGNTRGDLFFHIHDTDKAVASFKGGGAPGVGVDNTTLFGGATASSGYNEALVWHGVQFRFDFRDGAESTWVDVYTGDLHAEAVYVDETLVHSSSREFKRDIRPLERGCLDCVRAVPMNRYSAGGVKTLRSSDGSREEVRNKAWQGIGPVAEDMPPDLRADLIEPGDGKGVNFTKSLWWLWGAVQELAEKIDDVERSIGVAREQS